MRFLTVCVLLTALPALGDDVFAPAANITTDGIPPVPRAVVDKIDRYANYRATTFAQWHPDRLEMLDRKSVV